MARPRSVTQGPKGNGAPRASAGRAACRTSKEGSARLASFPLLNPNPVAEVDPAGRVAFANPAARRLFPDLDEAGAAHPWFAGWVAVLEASRKSPSELPDREVSVGGRWYHQSLLFVPESGCVRFYGLDITEHKRTEEALRRRTAELEAARAEAEGERRRLEAVLAALPVGVAITDADGGSLQTNEAYERLWGGPRPEVQSVEDYAAFRAWWADTGRPVAPEEWASALAVKTGEAVVGQLLELERFDGTRAHVVNSAAPVRDAGGAIVGSAVAIQDLTELRRTERELRASEKQLRQVRGLLEAVTTGTEVLVATVDREFRYSYFNEAYKEEVRRLSGREIHLGSSLAETFAHLPAQQEAVLAEWGRTLRGEARSYQIEFGAPGGYRRVYSVRHTPLRDSGGEVVGAGEVAFDVTDQVRVEEELRRSESLYRAIGESIDFGVWVCAPDGRNTYASRSFLELLGITQEQCSEFGWGDALHPDDAERTVAAWKECARTGGTWDIEHRFRGADGRYHDVLARGVPVKDERGQILCWAGINLDIGRLKRAEHRLDLLARTAGELLRAELPQRVVEPLCREVMDYVDCDAFFNFLADERTRRLHLNAWSGISKEKARELEWLDYGVAVCGCAALEGRRIVAENIGETPDPRTELVASLGIRAYACYPLAAQGRVLGTLSFGARNRPRFSEEELSLMRAVADLVSIAVERGQAQEKLRKGEQRLRFHVENFPAAVVEWDANLVVTRWAGAAEKIFGWSAAEMVGRSIPDVRIVVEEDLPRVAKVIANLTAGKLPYVVSSNRNYTKDGRIVHCEWYNSVLPGPDGRIESVLSLVLDITERVRHEQELLKARADADAASRAKSDFLAHMSHEIRTPMNGILGMAELLSHTALDARQRGQAEAILSSGRTLLGILNDVLDFSKIEAGRLTLESAAFDLAEAVEDAVYLAAEIAAGKGLELGCLLAEDVPRRVVGDRTRLQQVLLNLTGNAVKFTGAGEVAVRAALQHRDGDRALVRFEVADTGIGIPEGLQETLFEPFVQTDTSTTRRYGGSGLGLAICRRLVHAMGGRIGFESREGKGSVFWFTVPFRLAAVRDEPAPFAGRRALVADGCEGSRSGLRAQLSRLGVRAETAADGPTAAALVKAARERGEPFDVAFVDSELVGLGDSPLAGLAAGGGVGAAPPVVLLLPLAGGVREPVPAWERAAASLVRPVREGRLAACLRAALGQAAPTGLAPAAGREPEVPRGRVLVAEDNPVNQAVAQGMLEALGFEVDVVEDGAAAVEAACAGCYDAVFLDWRMPVMDGLDAAREIRRREDSARRTLLVATTANATAADRLRCLEAGMDEHLPKPLTLESLSSVLSGFVRRPSAPAAGPGGAATRPAGKPAEATALDSFVTRAAKHVGPISVGRFRHLLALFFEDGAGKIERLREAAVRRDFAEVSSLAHGLRGGGMLFGSDRFAELAEALEYVSPEEAPERLGALVERLAEELRSIERFSRSGGLAHLGIEWPEPKAGG